MFLEELVAEMIEMDKKIAQKDLLIKNKGLYDSKWLI